jgi:lysyl-tRNA synthetase class 2
MALAKYKHDGNENDSARRVTESFQLIPGSEDTDAKGGPELVKGFSEMNDPRLQRAQMEEQEARLRKGDEEEARLDKDFLEALEYGMPPAAGFGLSERLFAILMDKPVRETVVFPLMRPKKKI